MTMTSTLDQLPRLATAANPAVMSSIRANANIPGPNLFLRHLPPHMMETELESLLGQHGRLKRLTVWKDHQTRLSKGFGMAEFDTTASAVNAVKALQGHELIEGNPLEMEYHHGKRRTDGTPDIGAPCTNLYVRGLPPAMTEDQLRDILTRYGEIKRHTIWKDQFGNSKGFGMCEFRSADQARLALEDLRGKTFDSTNVLHVEVNPPKARIPLQQGMSVNSFSAPVNQTPVPNIFIKGLPLTFEEADLRNLVSRFGNVKRATIWRCRNTGQSKGFGLVELGDVQQATVAMEGLNHCLLEGSTGPLQVEFNHPKPSKGNTQPDATAAATCSNIFLKCLPLNCTDTDLHALLSPFGRIVRSTIWKDNKTNQSRGFGFCEFSSPVSATSAIQALNGRVLQGSMIPIHVELHTRNTPTPASLGQASGGAGSMGSLGAAGLASTSPTASAAPLVGAAMQQFTQPAVQHIPIVNQQALASPPTGVLVKGLPKTIRDSDLKQILEQYGRVQRCVVVKDRNPNEPFGLVQFETFAAASNAISQLSNQRLTGATSPLSLELSNIGVAEEPIIQPIAEPAATFFQQDNKTYTTIAQPIMTTQSIQAHRPVFP